MPSSKPDKQPGELRRSGRLQSAPLGANKTNNGIRKSDANKGEGKPASNLKKNALAAIAEDQAQKKPEDVEMGEAPADESTSLDPSKQTQVLAATPSKQSTISPMQQDAASSPMKQGESAAIPPAKQSGTGIVFKSLPSPQEIREKMRSMCTSTRISKVGYVFTLISFGVGHRVIAYNGTPENPRFGICGAAKIEPRFVDKHQPQSILGYADLPELRNQINDGYELIRMEAIVRVDVKRKGPVGPRYILVLKKTTEGEYVMEWSLRSHLLQLKVWTPEKFNDEQGKVLKQWLKTETMFQTAYDKSLYPGTDQPVADDDPQAWLVKKKPKDRRRTKEGTIDNPNMNELLERGLVRAQSQPLSDSDCEELTAEVLAPRMKEETPESWGRNEQSVD